ncbi:uncharacterized protein LOC141913980 [Tubulanus polymorphus]|uniref:uncharacterized protein LOC141913980 n=1 Tax=Tubulanus polymorphus TaxID=672921 RepID=UPI003DA4FF5C
MEETRRTGQNHSSTINSSSNVVIIAAAAGATNVTRNVAAEMPEKKIDSGNAEDEATRRVATTTTTQAAPSMEDNRTSGKKRNNTFFASSSSTTTAAGTTNLNVTVLSASANQNDGDGFRLSIPAIIGLALGGVLVLLVAGLLIGYFIYRHRHLKVTSAKQAKKKDDGWDDTIALSYINSNFDIVDWQKEISDDVVSLDNDQFLNSLESMMFSNLWMQSAANISNAPTAAVPTPTAGAVAIVPPPPATTTTGAATKT